jgi:acid stress-induced BolA-like protein IbaG/YrbA
MNPEKLSQLILQGLPGASVEVTSGDNVHFDAVVVSSDFVGLSPVKAQQKVYQALGTLITDGTIHALSLKTRTPD